MKAKLLLICMLAGLILMSSCEKKELNEGSLNRPIYLQVLVLNETGDYVFDVNSESSILEKEISVTYEGITYPLSEYSEDDKFVFSTFDSPIIFIGPFDSMKTEIYILVLHLGKAEYTIKIDNYPVKDEKSRTGYTYLRKFYLNDELVEGPTDSVGCQIKIVLNPV